MEYFDFLTSLIDGRDLFLILIGAIASIITTYFARTRTKGDFFNRKIGNALGEDLDFGFHVCLSALAALFLLGIISFIIYYVFSFLNQIPEIFNGLPDLIKAGVILFGFWFVLKNLK